MKDTEQEEISIKVNIADVVYPLKIKPSEEENVRKAAKMINDKLKAFKEDYQIDDKQVLLSMASLQFATELLFFKEEPMIKEKGISDKLNEIDNILTDSLTLK